MMFFRLLASCRLPLGALLLLCVFTATGCEPIESESAGDIIPASASPPASDPETAPTGEAEDWPFPVPESACARYTAYRTIDPITVDGKLDEETWQQVPRSPRFTDLVSGREVVHDTRAAVTWDDEYLYVGFWIEEPNVHADHMNRDAPIYSENDIELFVAGADAYYEFEMNAYGTIYEVFFIWEDAYEEGGYAEDPTLARDLSSRFEGVRFKPHPRGSRLGFFDWDFPELEKGVFVDGTINNENDRDRGWTAEIALPWKHMQWLAVGDGRSLPPEDGDVWRIDFSRFNYYREAPVPPSTDSPDCGGWVWSPHGTYDSHVPEVYPFITFSTQPVPDADSAP